MTMFKKIWRLFMPAPLRAGSVRDAESLADFLDREAALLAQKSTFDYSRARAMLHWSKLFSEPDFVAALDGARWRAYGALLPDMAVLVQRRLRWAGADPARLGPWLAQIVQATAARHPPPSWCADGWPGLLSNLEGVLEAARFDDEPIATRVWPSVGAIFDAMPIHLDIRRADKPVIESHLRMGLIAFDQRLGRALGPIKKMREIDAFPTISSSHL